MDFLVSLMVVGGLDEVSDQILEAFPTLKKFGRSRVTFNLLQITFKMKLSMYMK